MHSLEILSSALRTAKALSTLALACVLLSACGGGGVGSAPAAAPGSVAPSYIKICNNGENEDTSACPAKPVLGSKPTDWACTLDTKSGLIWEVKTPWQTNPPVEDFRNTKYGYTNYDNTNSPQLFVPGLGGVNGTFKNPDQAVLDLPSNALGYARMLNGLTGLRPLCGRAGWRRPTRDELLALVDLSVSSIAATPTSPAVTLAAINQTYFPNTNPSEPYISSTPTADRAYDPIRTTDNITFKTFNKTLADQVLPWGRGFNSRAPILLVADCNCKPVGNTQSSRSWGKSVLLPNGTVLTVGGSWLNTAQFSGFGEIFDPATEQWTSSGPFASTEVVNLPIDRHSVTLVGDKVVVMGGVYFFNPIADGKNVWIYDTVSQIWSKGKSSKTMHIAHGAVAMGSNKLLVLGGDCLYQVSKLCNSGSVEEYDVANDSWTTKTPMPTPVQSASTTVLADGRILMVGGSDNISAVSTVQIYNPQTNTWATGLQSMTLPRYYHTATLLTDGRLLVTGGNTVVGNVNIVGASSKTAEIYDLATNVWTPAPALSAERVNHTATRLLDGRVLLAGGRDQGSTNTSAKKATSTVEIYDPKTNQWTPACSLLNVRHNHNATVLAGGVRILISDGNDLTTSVTSAEIYTP